MIIDESLPKPRGGKKFNRKNVAKSHRRKICDFLVTFCGKAILLNFSTKYDMNISFES